MAGVPAGLPAGVRISDHISLGVIARAFPPDRVQQILAETGKASERERDLPAGVVQNVPFPGNTGKGPSQDWGCGGQLAIFAFVLWPRVDAWLGC